MGIRVFRYSVVLVDGEGILCLKKFAVALFKAFIFFLLIGKALDNPDAQKAVFHLRVELANLLTLPFECIFHALAKEYYGQKHERQKGKDDERERHIYAAKNNKRANNLDAANEKLFGAVVGKFGDVEKVI